MLFILATLALIISTWYLGLEKSYFLLKSAYHIISKRLLLSAEIFVGDNHNHFMVRGRFSDLDEISFCVPSLNNMNKYTIKAISITSDEIKTIGLIKIVDCYLGADVSCDILGVYRIIVWVYDNLGNLIGTEEITNSRTIRNTVLDIINKPRNVNINTTIKDIPDSEIEPEADEQD